MGKLKYKLNPIGNANRKAVKGGVSVWSSNLAKKMTRSGYSHSFLHVGMYRGNDVSFRPTLKATK